MNGVQMFAQIAFLVISTFLAVPACTAASKVFRKQAFHFVNYLSTENEESRIWWPRLSFILLSITGS